MAHEITNGKTKIKCPETNCKTGQFKLEELEGLVDNKLCLKIMKLAKDKSVVLSHCHKWCPEPDCNTICTVPTKVEAKKICCSKCKKEFCSKCSQDWSQHHSPRECQSSIITQDNIKPCPLCQVPIQKTGWLYCCILQLQNKLLLGMFDKIEAASPLQM